MNKSKKIVLIVTPIAILMSGILGYAILEKPPVLQSENRQDNLSSEKEGKSVSSLNLPVVGFSDAPVTIIAFNDYQCKDCKTWYENEYDQISENLIDTGKANMVFVDSMSLGKNSVLISEATFCANEHGKYSEYQEIVFKTQQRTDDGANMVQLKQFATDLGLDPEVFQECLDSRKYENKVLSNIEYAKNLGVDKIPVFKIINLEGKEHILKGGLPSSSFEDVVNRFQ